jgi:hypothetical protein
MSIRRAVLCLAFLTTGCSAVGLISNNAGGLVGAAPPASSPAARVHQAVQLANGALADLYRYDVQLRTAPNRQALLTEQEQTARDAVQAVFNLVADAKGGSPPDYVQVYQIAKDALDSGRLVPDQQQRIEYYRGALTKIGAMGG